MSKSFNIAVVGATGAVGETILQILEERKFPVNNLYPLASERSAGKTMMFHGKPLYIESLADFDFSKTDMALFSAGGSVSKKYAPIAAKAGCIVIDNTSQFRNDPEIPLIISEVNPEALDQYKKTNIIANPNCSTMQMLVALNPIHQVAKITRINVATYQAVSGAGKSAIKELIKQITDALNGRPPKSEVFSQQIAFNALPHIDVFQDNGYTREEMKMVWETQKILNDENIKVNPTAVRVPVIYGHSEAVHIETKEKITAEQARKILAKAPGVKVMDDPKKEKYPTALSQATGKDAVYVGRIREDISVENGLNLWIVSDNIRKGAALNAVQIAELLAEKL